MTSTSISRQELAELLSVTPRAVADMEKRGLPADRSARHPRYDPAEAVAWYVDAKVAEAMLRRAPADLEAARARKTTADARLRELDLAFRQGELVRVDDAVAELDRMLDGLRARLVGFPGRWGLQLVGLKSPPEATAKLEQGVRELMELLVRVPADLEARDA